MEDFWIIAGNVALFVAACVTTSLVLVYGLLTQWERTRVGRQFMLNAGCLAVILDFIAIATIVSTRPQMYTPLTPIRMFIYGGVAIVQLRWLMILIHEQRLVRSKRNEDLRP